MSGPIRVMIVDDHAVVREGLRAVLEADDGLAVAGEAGGVAEAVALAGRERPDVILLDITMPGGSGLEAVPRLRAVSDTSRILMLSVHDNVEYVLQAVRAGAHGYLRKDTTPAELRRAVRAVHGGDAFFSPVAARHLSSALRGETAPPAADAGGVSDLLTAREREVLVAVARGQTNKATAAALGISVRTVEAHRDSLMKKTGVRTVAGLTRLALDAGLLSGA